MFFDTHCHLAGDELIPHASELIQRGLGARVQGFAIIAADEASLRATPALVKKLQAEAPQALVVGTSGLHPHEADLISDELWQLVVDQGREAVAIGETGLDYYYDHSDRQRQKEYFDRHIELACQLQKPLVIHCRQAVEDILGMLDRPGIKNHKNPGILHCFTEDEATARKLLDWNFYISFSGILSFKNAEVLRKVAAFVPPDRLLIETDSPWLAPIPHRGKRNEPSFVPHTFAALTALRPESPAELERILWENSCRVFGLKGQA
ncbi:MAG: TatD family hydrolase [Bdellovibrionales bacterium]|nr:TatD family hydrolase [Bdellovibrionales bacterium]